MPLINSSLMLHTSILQLSSQFIRDQRKTTGLVQGYLLRCSLARSPTPTWNTKAKQPNKTRKKHRTHKHPNANPTFIKPTPKPFPKAASRQANPTAQPSPTSGFQVLYYQSRCVLPRDDHPFVHSFISFLAQPQAEARTE